MSTFSNQRNEQAERILRKFVGDEITKMSSYIEKTYKFQSFIPVVRLSFSGARNRSWGGVKHSGKPFISLALVRFLPFVANELLTERNNKLCVFNEYRSFQHDPVIGTVSGHWQKCVRALIAHELSHAVQYYRGQSNDIALRSVGNQANYNFAITRTGRVRRVRTDASGHGPLFKQIYRNLRIEFVNGVVENTPINDLAAKSVNEKVSKTTSISYTRKSGKYATAKKVVYKNNHRIHHTIYSDAVTGNVIYCATTTYYFNRGIFKNKGTTLFRRENKQWVQIHHTMNWKQEKKQWIK